MTARRIIKITITPDEMSALISGHVRDTYGIVAEQKHIETGEAFVTIEEDIKPKMSREMRPPSKS